MIYEYEINGVPLQTGDLICTTDWGAPVFAGQFWRLIGNLIPGDVDHVAVYVGPAGRCVEAGAKGRVVTYQAANRTWDSLKMREQRGEIIDGFYGVAYPLLGRGLSQEWETAVRENVAHYCLQQAELEKPYNLNFFNSSAEDSFYCSQLAYQAYLKNGIDLNTRLGIPGLPGTESIIFPEEIWSGCANTRSSWLNAARAARWQES